MSALEVFSLLKINSALKLLCVMFSALQQCLHIYQRKREIFDSVLSNSQAKQLLMAIKILY